MDPETRLRIEEKSNAEKFFIPSQEVRKFQHLQLAAHVTMVTSKFSNKKRGPSQGSTSRRRQKIFVHAI